MKYLQILFKIFIFILYVAFYIIFPNQEFYAQTSTGGLPYSFVNKSLSSDIDSVYFPAIDVKSLLYEDSLDAVKGDVPFRFGKDLDVDISIDYKDDKWVNCDDGRIWRTGLYAEGAASLNLIFENFYIPSGGKLFIYTPGYKNIIGAFTSANNYDDGIFATTVLPGDKIIIEYFEPLQTHGKVSFTIKKLIYGYKNIFFQGLKGYGSSGSCNINVNCPEGALWQDNKRAVALIMLQNNSRICSGTLVNNTRNDAVPYILTANHCLGQESTWIFMFNYESQGCTNANGPTNYTVQGSMLRATDIASDFALVEMKSMPPLNYNVYYAGWSAKDIAADSCTVIHHPSGDIKKITFDFDTVVSSAWSSGVAGSHWTVGNWEKGTTEPGSSGSPLFNKKKQIIGQLHGGSASCDIISDDNFGKFSYSWNSDPSPARQLKYWLDPLNSGLTELNGYDFNSPSFAVDAALDEILIPSAGNVCKTSFSPAFIIRNNGADTLKNMSVSYSVDGGAPLDIIWNGALPYLVSSSIVLPQTNFASGIHNLKIYINSVNGNTDQNHLNDTVEVNFDVINGSQVDITFKTDIYPSETSWTLTDSADNVLYYNPVLTPNTVYEPFFCLPYGCYNVYVYDKYGDGMSGSVSKPDTGYVSIYSEGDFITGGGGNFGNVLKLSFCLPYTGIEQHSLPLHNTCMVYPNPSRSSFNVIVNKKYSGPADFEMLSPEGKLVYSGQLDFINGNSCFVNNGLLNGGIYFGRIVIENESFFIKIMIADF